MSAKRKEVAAIEAVNVSKKYSKNGQIVLEDLNVRVDKGTIYGLLGSSGCGKTTLLSIIVGLRKPDAGEVFMYGKETRNYQNGVPGKTLGFMPQELGLYTSFTIAETFSYFGKINSMSPEKVAERGLELHDLLKFPKLSKRIATLSGGQKRRVSLAVAMLHEPELLILDEPTVGVDPLLREKIWEHLTSMVKQKGITVLVTTHYTEETRECDKIGVMRNGKLLIEESPKVLLEQCNATTLEDVVLLLCKTGKDAFLSPPSSNSDSNAIQNKISDNSEEDYVECVSYRKRHESNNLPEIVVSSTFQPPQTDSHCVGGFKRNVDVVCGLVKRNWINTFRHPQLTSLLIMIPLVHAILGVYVMGKPPAGVSVGMVNYDLSPALRNVTAPGSINFCEPDQGLYSCGYWNHLKKSLDVKIMTNEDAKKRIAIGNIKTYLVVPENFTQNMNDRLAQRQYAANETLDGSSIQVFLDTTEYIRNQFVVRVLMDEFGLMVEDVIKDFDVDINSVRAPIEIKAIYGNQTLDWNESMVPSFLIFCAFILQTMVGLFHIVDKKTGTLQRTIVSGVGYGQILASYIISTTPILLAQTITMVAFLYLEYEMQGSWGLYLLQCFLAGMSGAGLGLLFGAIFTKELEGIFAVVGIFITNQVLCGLTWPLVTYPWFIKPIAYMLPLTLPLQSLRAIFSRGWGLEHSEVMYGFAASSTYILVCTLLAFFIQKYNR